MPERSPFTEPRPDDDDDRGCPNTDALEALLEQLQNRTAQETDRTIVQLVASEFRSWHKDHARLKRRVDELEADHMRDYRDADTRIDTASQRLDQLETTRKYDVGGRQEIAGRVEKAEQRIVELGQAAQWAERWVYKLSDALDTKYASCPRCNTTGPIDRLRGGDADTYRVMCRTCEYRWHVPLHLWEQATDRPPPGTVLEVPEGEERAARVWPPMPGDRFRPNIVDTIMELPKREPELEGAFFVDRPGPLPAITDPEQFVRELYQKVSDMGPPPGTVVRAADGAPMPPPFVDRPQVLQLIRDLIANRGINPDLILNPKCEDLRCDLARGHTGPHARRGAGWTTIIDEIDVNTP